MARSTSEITSDLEKIRVTLSGLRAGFVFQKPIVSAKLGDALATAVFRIVGNVLDVQDTIVATLTQIHDRQIELDRAQAKIVDGIGETVRTLA